MFFAVSAARMLSMLSRMRGMTLSGVGMMRRLLVAASVVVFGSLLVVPRSVGAMFRCLTMMVSSFF